MTRGDGEFFKSKFFNFTLSMMKSKEYLEENGEGHYSYKNDMERMERDKELYLEYKKNLTEYLNHFEKIIGIKTNDDKN